MKFSNIYQDDLKLQMYNTVNLIQFFKPSISDCENDAGGMHLKWYEKPELEI